MTVRTKSREQHFCGAAFQIVQKKKIKFGIFLCLKQYYSPSSCMIFKTAMLGKCSKNNYSCHSKSYFVNDFRTTTRNFFLNKHKLFVKTFFLSIVQSLKTCHVERLCAIVN